MKSLKSRKIFKPSRPDLLGLQIALNSLKDLQVGQQLLITLDPMNHKVILHSDNKIFVEQNTFTLKSLALRRADRD